MPSIFQTYLSLSSSQEPQKELQSIIDAIPTCFDVSTRAKLISVLLDDLQAAFSNNPSTRLTQQDAAKALLAVKTLGRNPSGSELLRQDTTLITLLSMAKTLIEKGDEKAASEALRCVANTMWLFADSRVTFVSEEVKGGRAALEMLHTTLNPDLIFVLSRVLWLATVSQNDFILTFVEDERVDGRASIEIIASKLETTLASFLEGAELGRDAMSELLKFTYNLLLHYPKMTESEPQTSTSDGAKIMGDFWSTKLDGVLLPLLQIYLTLPTTTSVPLDAPLTNVIHTLITIPIGEPLKSFWFGTEDERSDTSHGVLQRTLEILNSTFSLYFPSNSSPDDEKIRESFKQSLLTTNIPPDTSPDELLTPLVVLCTRLVLADKKCRSHIREWIVPENLDRTNPLDGREDFLGKCLRLLASVYHPLLKNAVGELLFAVADSDATTMSSLFGYGHVAGFLFEKDFKAPPPSKPSTSTSAEPSIDHREVHPITGTFVNEQDKGKSPADDMSPEEKEREMEKLFVLFDRLEKTGTLPPDQNPMRTIIQKSMQQGSTPQEDDED
ncbi:hypothetical protein D9758_005977 [Tetrapyrgos nigripes]|uniref:Uncharacterized protein n=1 Tax=Tetrapyrgos nigripes TaxID=182062 RepID=A0A8H5FZR5_9AGAR|nr:hypothetical protein D9758_005977 [Tetrapyrgos nigripes]